MRRAEFRRPDGRASSEGVPEGGTMNRGAGTGLIAFGIVLAVIVSILYFAIKVTTTGFNVNTTGLILLIVGIVAVVIGLGVFMAGSYRRSVLHEDVHATPGGQERTVEQRDNLAS